MRKKEYERARAAIRETARREGKSEEEVRQDIQDAIRQGMENARQSGDRTALQTWATIKCKGEEPTPEEFIAWISKLLRIVEWVRKWFGWLFKR